MAYDDAPEEYDPRDLAKFSDEDLDSIHALIEVTADEESADMVHGLSLSKDLQEAWDQWRHEVQKAAKSFIYNEVGARETGEAMLAALDLMDQDLAFITYMQFDGHGIGVWDGRYDWLDKTYGDKTSDAFADWLDNRDELNRDYPDLENQISGHAQDADIAAGVMDE